MSFKTEKQRRAVMAHVKDPLSLSPRDRVRLPLSQAYPHVGFMQLPTGEIFPVRESINTPRAVEEYNQFVIDLELSKTLKKDSPQFFKKTVEKKESRADYFAEEKK